MRTKWLGIIGSIVVILALSLGVFGCAKAPTTASKTLKIGLNIALNWPIGTDTLKAIPIDVDKVNEEGGLRIGGDRYNIELVVDDNKMDMALAKTAAEKEIHQDGVKFILGDLFCTSYFPLTEQNKVIALATPADFSTYNKNYQYCWQACPTNTNMMSLLPYVALKFPNKKTFVSALPDNVMGHGYGDQITAGAKNCGLELLELVYYPPTGTDMSAVGTKVKTLNPELFWGAGGGPQLNGLVLKAVHGAGYTGQIFSSSTEPTETIIAVAGADSVEGMLAGAWPVEFDPAVTSFAKEFKADYIAKYGKWDSPEVVMTNTWFVLRAALQEADSLDADKVKAVLDKGMKYDSPLGAGQMFGRPDLGLTRTVDTIMGDWPVKQIVGGQRKLYDTIGLSEMNKLIKTLYAIK